MHYARLLDLKASRLEVKMGSTAYEVIFFILLGLLGLKIIWNVCYFFYTTYLGSWLGLNLDLSKYGPWAVVTGSTDGIGKEYAKQLAAKGLNIVLISRSPAKLQDTKTEIEKLQPSIKVKTIAIDFTKDKTIYRQMEDELRDLEIGVLVNNVGMAVLCEYFTDMQSEKVIDDMIACNILSVPRMIHMILPGMLQRKRGVILNIGSIAGATYTPLSALYGATKAFVNKFSQDLEVELRGSGVIVQTVAPGYVMTNMVTSNTRVQASFAAPYADEYVKANFRTLGLESFTGSYWFHKIQHAICRWGCFFFPETLKTGTLLAAKNDAKLK